MDTSENTLGPAEDAPTNKQDQQRENVGKLVIWGVSEYFYASC